MTDILTDHERAMADEGIERVEAAIMRSVEKGVPLDEAVDRHVNAVLDTWPHAGLCMVMRMAELSVERGLQA